MITSSTTCKATKVGLHTSLDGSDFMAYYELVNPFDYIFEGDGMYSDFSGAGSQQQQVIVLEEVCETSGFTYNVDPINAIVLTCIVGIAAFFLTKYAIFK